MTEKMRAIQIFGLYDGGYVIADLSGESPTETVASADELKKLLMSEGAYKRLVEQLNRRSSA